MFVHVSYGKALTALVPHSVLPTISGECDKEKFYVQISFGNMGKNLNVMLGTRDLTPERKSEYELRENGTHMSLAVPFLAADVAFEVRKDALFSFI